jgi:hypothetical protein
MARIRNRDDFKSSILLRLGEPVVNLVIQAYGSIDCAVTSTTGASGTNTVESSGSSGTESVGPSGCPQIVSSVMNQLDLVIDDALDYFKTASTGTSNEEDILLIELQAGKTVYQVCDDVLAVQQPMQDGGSGLGSNFDSEEAGASAGLFSIQNSLGGSGMYGHTSGGGAYDNLLTTEIALEYASLVKMRYQKKFESQFNDAAKEVLIFPTPKAGDQGKVIAMVVQREVADEKLFSDVWLQEYAVSLLSIQLGRNLSSMIGFQLPGGGEYNASFYYDNGISERDRLREDLMMGSYGNNEFLGGGFYTG